MNADSKITPSCAHGPPSNKKKQFQRHRKTIQFSQSVQLMTTCWVCAIVKQKTKKLQPFIPWKPTYLTGPADSKIMNVYISEDIGLNKRNFHKKTVVEKDEKAFVCKGRQQWRPWRKKDKPREALK
jgi:hypothetical protein